MKPSPFFPILALLLFLLTTGCRTQSARAPELSLGDLGLALREKPAPARQAVPAPIQPEKSRITEEAIRRLLEENPFSSPPTQLPVRLALVELRRRGDGVEALPIEVRWTEAFRTALLDRPDLVARVQTIPAPFLPHQADLPALRYQTLRTGANHLLVFTRGIERAHFTNGWSALYATILGVFFIPGESHQSRAAARGALIEASTGRVLAIVEGDVFETLDRTPISSEHRFVEQLDARVTGRLFTTLATRTGQALESPGSRNDPPVPD